MAQTFPYSVISVQMLKGGVAKTTTVLNLGYRAAHYGARVLYLDLDQQANLTYALGVDDENLPVWLDVVEKKVSIEDAIVSTGHLGLDLLPSSLNNSVLERVLFQGSRNWAQAVKAPLEKVKGKYDLILIDTAPNLSATNTAVTCASDLVILPVNPDKFALQGLKKHLVDLAEIKKEFDLDFEEKILFTKFDARETSSREMLENCINDYADLMMKSYIRTSTILKNSIGSTKTIFNSQNPAKEDYDLVTREVLGLSVE